MSPETSDTKVCPYCAETIKAAAVVCRYCGRALPAASGPFQLQPARAAGPAATPPRDKSGRGKVFALVILLLLVASYWCTRGVGVGTSTRSAARATPTPIAWAESNNAEPAAAATHQLALPLVMATEATATVEPTATSVPAHKLNEDVVLGEIRWRVLAVVDHGQVLKSNNQFTADASTQGRFIRVTYEVENLGKERDSFLGVDLADAQGRTYGSYDKGSYYIDGDRSCVLLVMQPNLPDTCEVIFETPANATGLKLKITDNAMFSSAEDFVELGL